MNFLIDMGLRGLQIQLLKNNETIITITIANLKDDIETSLNPVFLAAKISVK